MAYEISVRKFDKLCELPQMSLRTTYLGRVFLYSKSNSLVAYGVTFADGIKHYYQLREVKN